MDTPNVAAYRAASQFFVDVVAAVPPERYEEAWSDEWRVLDLIGHGNRAHVLPVEYHEHPVEPAGPEYVLPENIAARGRAAVEALGPDPVAGVRAARDRVLAMVASASDDATVGTPFGTRDLDTYLASRTAELVLHGLDLGTDVVPPDDAVTACGEFLVREAVRRGRGVEVLRALSGRGSLAPDFSVF